MKKSLRFIGAGLLVFSVFGVYAQSKDALMRMRESGRVQSFLLVSSHIPIEDLVGLARTAATADIPLVFNGVVGAVDKDKLDLQKSQEWVLSLKRECCTDSNLTTFIDPTLFTRFQVESAPVLVISRGDEFTKMAGVAPLSELLKQTAQRSKLPWVKAEAEKRFLKLRTTTD
jgi:hypothetical protein